MLLSVLHPYSQWLREGGRERERERERREGDLVFEMDGVHSPLRVRVTLTFEIG